jgi:hypothetical protein
MNRPRKELIICALAVAFLVVAQRPSIGVAISVPAGHLPGLIGTGHHIVVESIFGTKGMNPVPPLDGIPPSSDDASTEYIYQASNNDLVQCSYVSKVIICHRTVRSCAHRLLLRPLRMQAPELPRNRLLPLVSECL